MSDIYLSIAETPTVVTLTNPLISSNVAQSVTVTNVVSVNVVTMPAITVQAAAPSVTTVAGTVAVSNFPAVTTVAGTVALDANSLSALENVTVTVGAAVSVSNFPSTQTIAGTVTANVAEPAPGVSTFISESGSFSPIYAVGIGYNTANNTEFLAVNDSGNNFPVAVNNSVTIGSLPAISGTVTVGNSVTVGFISAAVLPRWEDDNQGGNQRTAKQSTPFPVRIYGDASSTSVTFGATITNSVTIGSLPAISGTVTANNPSGALTARFGSVTTANLSQITTAVTNTSRKYLLAQNISAGTVTIGIGFSPTTTQGIQLTAGGGLTFDAFCPTGAVYWLGAVTGAAFTILEG